MAEYDSINKFLFGFVVAILGTILVTVIASQILLKTDYTAVSNEANAFTANSSLTGINTSELHTVVNYPTGWKLDDCPISSVVIKNASGGTALTADTDYTLYANNGTFVFIDTDNTDALLGEDNNTYIDYKYCGDDYLNAAWGRNVLNLTPGLFVIMVLVAIIALVYTFIRMYQK